MLRIEIEKDSLVNTQTRRGKNGEFEQHKQPALLWREGDRHPDKFQLIVENKMGVTPGMYTLSDQAYRIGQYGDLELNPFQLSQCLVPEKAREAKTG